MANPLKALILLPFQLIGKLFTLSHITLWALLSTIIKTIIGILSHTLGGIFGGLSGIIRGLFTGLGGSKKK